MTAKQSEQRAPDGNDPTNQPATSDFVPSSEHESEHDSERESERNQHGQSNALSNALANSTELPRDLQRALRAARTPLIEGVDFNAHRGALPSEATVPRSAPAEKSRVDTLSPRESVPPPAPFPAEPPPARPAVVPPVRLPYNDPVVPRTRSDPPPRGIRSDPPPRIPISDRPSRPVYRSDPPPRLSSSDPPPRVSSRSDPPPKSSRRSPADSAASLLDPMVVASSDARRREAVTIPADANSPGNAHAYDPSLPLPPLRAPSFPVEQRPMSIRQHENNRLRNVAMTMMFVIFIVTGALAGMRWFVDRDEGDAAPPAVTPPERSRVSRVRNESPTDNSKVQSTEEIGRPPDDEQTAATESSPAALKSPGSVAREPRTGTSPDSADGEPSRDPTGVSSPWPRESGGSKVTSQTRKSTREGTTSTSSTSKKDARKKDRSASGKKAVDTKTPLLPD